VHWAQVAYWNYSSEVVLHTEPLFRISWITKIKHCWTSDYSLYCLRSDKFENRHWHKKQSRLDYFATFLLRVSTANNASTALPAYEISVDLTVTSGIALKTKSKYKSIYLNKSLNTQVPKDTDACPTKENNITKKHTGLSELHTHKGGKLDKF